MTDQANTQTIAQSLSINDSPVLSRFGACIVTATNGFVWIAEKAEQDEHWFHLQNARIIRVWGTTEGLAQLVDGKTKETVLDKLSPLVSITWDALISVIPANSTAWEQDLTV